MCEHCAVYTIPSTPLLLQKTEVNLGKGLLNWADLWKCYFYTKEYSMEMHQPGCFKLINPQSYEEFSRGYMSLWTALHTGENKGKKI